MYGKLFYNLQRQRERKRDRDLERYVVKHKKIEETKTEKETDIETKIKQDFIYKRDQTVRNSPPNFVKLYC